MIEEFLTWLREMSTLNKVLATVIIFLISYVFIFFVIFALCEGELPKTWLGDKAARWFIIASAYLITSRMIWKTPKF